MRAFDGLRSTGAERRRSRTSSEADLTRTASIRSEANAELSRRAYFRVQTHIPLRLGWLTSEQAQVLVHSIETSRRDELSIRDDGLRVILQRIEEKLDLLLQAQQGGAPLSLGQIEPQRVALSGSGLETGTAEPFRPGDPVKVELLLPGTTPRPITALARVVYGPSRRVSEGQESVALAFSHVDESDRDAIVRHVYDVQRLMLRERKQPGEQR